MPHRRQGAARFLATVLFTDIVGSTSRAAELGDRAWRDLLERHHAVVRRELKAFGGREMDTAGDGFFAVFETPERAVRCAESIISAVRPLGLEVRAGVHTGECEVVDGKVGGMTVTIGARISALADAGQVLVSRSVRDLMTGSGRGFEGGEKHDLKGVAERWRVYHLVPEQVDGDAVAPRRSLVPLYTRRQRRRLLVVIAGVTVVALAVSAGYVLTRPDPVVVVGEDAVGVIGPGDSAANAAVPVGKRPTAVSSGFGSVWVTNSADDSVSRVEPGTKVSVQIPVGSSPSGVAVGAGSVWVANSGDATVSRIDPTTSRPTTIIVAPGPTGVVVAFGSVWVTNALDAKVTEIDPDTNKVVKVVSVGAGPTGIAAGAGYLWVTNQGDGTVTRIDPDTHVTDSPIKVGNGPVAVAVAGSAAWVTNNLDGSLSRIDVDDLTVTSRLLAKRGGAYGVAARGDNVWVSNEYAGTLMRISSRPFQLADTVTVHGAPLGLGFVGDDLWFTSAQGGSALHRGGVLTLVAPGFEFDADPPVLDPTLHSVTVYPPFAMLAYDGLIGIRRSDGVDGAQIVPDLATSIPQPSTDGLTYTFHLRKGVRYSTGAPVLAGDIRRGMERVVVHPDSAPEYYTQAIVGARACGDAADKALAAHRPRPDCDLSRGIEADDRTGTITFHLARPTPEFLYQLSMDNASAVPQDTPVDLQPGSFLPATGPYTIHSYEPMQSARANRPARHGRLELVRNPFFHVWSQAAQPQGYPDRIVLETGYTDQQAVARVTNGQADMLWLGAPDASVDELKRRFGSQLRASTSSFLDYMFLDTSKPPFNSRDARRAVAFALDRAALTNGSTGSLGQPTCQVVPPNFAAHQPYCPYTVGDTTTGKWIGPDRAVAQELVAKSGTRGAKVVFSGGYDKIHRAESELIVATLNDLGYHATLQIRGSPTSFVPMDRDPRRSSWNAGLTDGWAADYPAASNYLATLAACRPDQQTTQITRYCDPGLDRQITATTAQQLSDPGRANDAWAAIDRKVVDAAAIIPIGISLRHDLVSRRVGNLLLNPINGPLIAQIWVQ